MIDGRPLLLDAQSDRQFRKAGVAGSLCLVALAVFPRAALAQAPAADAVPPVVAAPPVPPDALPPAPVAVPVVTPDVLSRVQEADQRSRITDRRLELLEEKLDKAAKEATAPSADERGFFLRSADRRTFVQVRGLLQIDTRWFLKNDTVNNNVAFNDNDSILIRRFRPEIGGTLVGLADFLFSPDFAGAATTVFDAYIDVHPFPWLRLHVGKFKTPLGLERLQSEGAYPFIERALDQNLTPGRDIGAALQGDIAGGIVNYSVGVYDGFPDNANNSGGARPDGDTDHAKDFIGRLLFQPFKAPGLADLLVRSAWASRLQHRRNRKGTCQGRRSRRRSRRPASRGDIFQLSTRDRDAERDLCPSARNAREPAVLLLLWPHRSSGRVRVGQAGRPASEHDRRPDSPGLSRERELRLWRKAFV